MDPLTSPASGHGGRFDKADASAPIRWFLGQTDGWAIIMAAFLVQPVRKLRCGIYIPVSSRPVGQPPLVPHHHGLQRHVSYDYEASDWAIERPSGNVPRFTGQEGGASSPADPHHGIHLTTLQLHVEQDSALTARPGWGKRA